MGYCVEPTKEDSAMGRRLNPILALVALLAIAISLVGFASSAEPAPAVVVGHVDGVINPMSSRYIARVLARGLAVRAEAVVLVLDTPGGLESAMREIVQTLLDAPVPVVVYVSPDGARATSAGMFITLAGHVAAMAPGTHIGAAHPVPLEAQVDSTLDDKATSDAVALAQSIASVRERNMAWVVEAVRENASLLALDAREAGVIDIVSPDLEALLGDIDGSEVIVAGESHTLRTRGAMLSEVPMRWDERLLHTITHPDIAYLLLALGTLLLLAELSEPGLGVGGVGAAVSYVLAFLALGSLPLNWAGVALLLVAVVMLAVALLSDADAVVTATALVPFVLGSLLLYAPFRPTSAAAPDLRVSYWLIALMALAMGGFSLIVVRAIVRASRLPPQSGPERLLGMRGLALTDLAPDGQVRVDLEDWSAVAVEGEVQAGQQVEITGVKGVHLQVAPVESESQGG